MRAWETGKTREGKTRRSVFADSSEEYGVLGNESQWEVSVAVAWVDTRSTLGSTRQLGALQCKMSFETFSIESTTIPTLSQKLLVRLARYAMLCHAPVTSFMSKFS